MKRFLLGTLLIMSMCITLVGCGKKEDDGVAVPAVLSEEEVKNAPVKDISSNMIADFKSLPLIVNGKDMFLYNNVEANEVKDILPLKDVNYEDIFTMDDMMSTMYWEVDGYEEPVIFGLALTNMLSDSSITFNNATICGYCITVADIVEPNNLKLTDNLPNIILPGGIEFGDSGIDVKNVYGEPHSEMFKSISYQFNEFSITMTFTNEKLDELVSYEVYW